MDSDSNWSIWHYRWNFNWEFWGIKKKIKENTLERLRWRIAKDLKLSPNDPSIQGGYEQLTWILANIYIDNEEYEKSLCDKCLSNFHKTKCPCCGDEIKDDNKLEINQNFDENRFNELAGGEK